MKNGAVFMVNEITESSTSKSQSSVPTLMGMASLVALDKTASNFFVKMGISFPSSLIVMSSVFAILSALKETVSDVADSIVDFYLPSLAFIKVWLPVFFVPPLVVLPLKFTTISRILGPILSLVVVGLVSSLVSTATVAEIFKPSFKNSRPGSDRYYVGMPQEPVPINPPSLKLPGIISPLLAMAASIISFKFGGTKVKAVSTKSFGISSTIFSYLFGLQHLPAIIRTVIHPVLICGGLTAILQVGFGKLSGLLPAQALTNYFGSGVAGAGDMISSLLGPAVISFGLQLYLHKQMLINNAARVLFTTVFSALIGLYSSAIMAQKVGFATVEAAVSPLTRDRKSVV